MRQVTLVLVAAVVVVLLAAVSAARSAAVNEFSSGAPGTLLLNMLTRDEAKHLDRVLPKWAKIIDYWIIGVDEFNTDNSEEIIRKHLGHIPGEIVVVHFDGMGPTWTKLVDRGRELFPQATHGLIADADFEPMQDTLDKRQLDIRCPKHMYTIWSSADKDRTSRKMDWIYRNIPGVKVSRRAHQTLEVPDFPGSLPQTIIDLELRESPGGFQDRSGQKSQRYISWLEKDLLEYPEDPRTLYYLGHAHWEIFLDNSANPSAEHWEHLRKSQDYFERRVAVYGNFEERFFAMVKLGEMHGRFTKKYDEALRWYKMCAETDPGRADGFFYTGQQYRLLNRFDEAVPWLLQAARFSMPERALFNWEYLYSCLTKLELGRAVRYGARVEVAELREIRKLVAQARCTDDAEIRSIVAFMDNEIARMRVDSRASSLPSQQQTAEPRGTPASSNQRQIRAALHSLLQFVDAHLAGKKTQMGRKRHTELLEWADRLRAVEQASKPSCRDYRLVTTPFLRWANGNAAQLGRALAGSLAEEWDAELSAVRAVCR